MACCVQTAGSTPPGKVIFSTGEHYLVKHIFSNHLFYIVLKSLKDLLRTIGLCYGVLAILHDKRRRCEKRQTVTTFVKTFPGNLSYLSRYIKWYYAVSMASLPQSF